MSVWRLLLGGVNAAAVGIVAAATVRMLTSSVARAWQMIVLLLAMFAGCLQEGPPGAAVATLAVVAAPFGLTMMAGRLDGLHSRPPMRAALRCLAPAALGLMAAGALTLGGSLEGSPEVGIAAAVALTLTRFDLSPAAVLVAAGVARLALYGVAGV